MNKRTRYLTIPENTITSDDLGNYYPDIMLFPIEEYKSSEREQKYRITQGDIDRWDLTISRYYGTPDYDDLVLWLNNKAAPYDLILGEEILLPAKKDLENFYVTNRKK